MDKPTITQKQKQELLRATPPELRAKLLAELASVKVIKDKKG